MYAWGNLLSYMPPELKYWGGAAAAATGRSPDASFVLAFTILSQTVGMPLGPALERSGLGARRTALLGAMLMGGGVLLASTATSLAAFVASYCVMFGLGVGIAYQMPLLTGAKWFPGATGAVSGVVIFGMGASAFFFNMLATRLGLRPAIKLVS
jgi:MFS family permease